MAANDWPATIPQNVLMDGYEGVMPKGAIRSAMDAGPPYQRQRFTAAPEPFRAAIHLTLAQYNTFMTFWKDTLGHGALPFNWKHPITGTTAELQFNVEEPPSIIGVSGDKYRVTMALEVLP